MWRYAMKKSREAAAIMEKAAERKRKIDDVESEPSSTSVQLKARRLSSENSAAAAETTSGDDSTCGSVTSGLVSASRCSSSKSSSEVAKEICSFADLEEENEELIIATSATDDSVDYFKEPRRGMAASSVVRAELGEPEFKTRPYELSSQRCSKVEKMPTELELEEFFAAAENNLQKQFIDKYNFDIVKDEPLEGRYEWVEVQLKP